MNIISRADGALVSQEARVAALQSNLHQTVRVGITSLPEWGGVGAPVGIERGLVVPPVGHEQCRQDSRCRLGRGICQPSAVGL